VKTRLASIVYTTAQIIFFPFIIVLLMYVHLKRRNKDRLLERCGFVPVSPINKKVIWFHAVSAGEVLGLQEIIATIKRVQPDRWCYVTVGTPIGRTLAEKSVGADCVSYLPYDFLPCMQLAYARIKPQHVVVVESELWPHLFFLAQWKHIPLFLLNARISQRSIKRIQMFAPFMRLLLNGCNSILTQSDADQATFINTIGLNKETVHSLGNIKAFNVFAKRRHYPTAQQTAFPVLLAGSIHPKEDLIYLALFKKLKSLTPDLKLVLVPRHFHWQEALIEHAQDTGYKTTVWTEEMPQTTPHQLLISTDIILVCRFGMLFELYQYATIFFLGGTFVPVGGHNLLEPAAWGTPAIVGPYHANCISTLVSLEKDAAAEQVNNEQELFNTAKEILCNRQKLAAMQQANNAWIKKEAHRVENTMRQTLFKSLLT
jgi:3-deoxy-D-manno-octulosonic-acid transferase